jgi:hypothetical protein
VIKVTGETITNLCFSAVLFVPKTNEMNYNIVKVVQRHPPPKNKQQKNKAKEKKKAKPKQNQKIVRLFRFYTFYYMNYHHIINFDTI